MVKSNAKTFAYCSSNTPFIMQECFINPKRISEEYWLVKHNLWHDEKDKLIEKLQAMNNASRNFDEGSNLLESFCKHARREFLRATPKKKCAILKMLGSNFVYKDKEVSVELTSVFNYLLNNHFVNYGAGDEARTRDILLGKVYQ